MKKLLKKIVNGVFIIILAFSFVIMLITVVYTLVDLSKNSYFDMSSKDNIEVFLKSFAWCSPIIAPVFVMFTVFYTFQTFKINNENKLFNNYIVPKEKDLNEKLKEISSCNKKIHHFISRNGREIMTKIIRKENASINNEERMKYYFNRYIRNEIKIFEHSGHFGSKCQNNCLTCINKNTSIAYNANSFKHFKLIAFDLFCVSFEYSNFDTDIKKEYEDSCRKIQ